MSSTNVYATIKFKEIINLIVIHERGYKTDFVYLTRSNKIIVTPNLGLLRIIRI